MDIHAFTQKLIAYRSAVAAGESVEGNVLADILQILARLEVKEGGPYAMSVGGDTDIGLNLAIACFLKAHDVELPNLDAYLKRVLRQKSLESQVVEQQTLHMLIGEYHAKDTAVLAEEEASEMSVTESRTLNTMRTQAQERFKTLAPELVENATKAMEQTIRGNPDRQMSLMAHYMREALGSKGTQFSDQYVAALGLANTFFWTAFIIYDDFWDEDEAADPRLLPTANLFARHYTDYFSTLLPETGFRSFFHILMDQLDAANTWEMHYCRMHCEGRVRNIPEQLPAYDDFHIKFYPAAGHVAGPVALFVELGFALESQEVEQLVRYFKHYLIAMQLNDDAHDWKEDLERGHISTAVYLLLERWQQHFPDKARIDLDADMPQLEHLFWFEVLVPLCESVLMHSAQSRTALESISILETKEPLERFITRNERVAQTALKEQSQSKDFLDAFA